MRLALRNGEHLEAARHARELAGAQGDPSKWADVYDAANREVEASEGREHEERLDRARAALRSDLRRDATAGLSLPEKGLLFIGGAALAGRVDDLIPNWRPLGASIPPSLMAVPLFLVAAYIARRVALRKTGDVCMALGIGFLASNLQRAIARRVTK